MEIARRTRSLPPHLPAVSLFHAHTNTQLLNRRAAYDTLPLLFPTQHYVIHSQQYVHNQQLDGPPTNQLQCLRHAYNKPPF
jgi:hypothetical protein